MKKAILAIMVLGLCFGLANAAMAEAPSETTTVTVTVNEIETLTVPATVAITLEAVDTTDPTKYARGTADAGGQLTYSHNSGTAKKITAKCDTTETGTDITITVKVDGGVASPAAVVEDGTGTTTDVELWTGIAAGGYEKELTWTADASLAGTPAGSYPFTVTFTTADVEATP